MYLRAKIHQANVTTPGQSGWQAADNKTLKAQGHTQWSISMLYIDRLQNNRLLETI